MIVALAPPEMLRRKASHGQPCSGCGLCCHVELCDMGAAAFKRSRTDRADRRGPCPALEWRDGRSVCGLLVNPTNHPRGYAVGQETAAKAAALLIDPGSGCDMSMAGDHDAAYRAACNERDARRRPLIRWALAVWGGRLPEDV